MLKSLFKDVAIYGAASAFSKVFGLLLIPVYTGFLTKQQYGTLDGLLILTALILPSIIFGQDSSIARYYFEIKNPEERRAMITESFLFQLVMGLLLVFFTLIAAPFISSSFFKRVDLTVLVRLSAVAIFFNWLLQFCANILKWTFKRWHYILLTTVAPVIIMAMTILIFEFTELRIEGVFIAQIVGYLLFGILGFWFIRNEFTLIKTIKWLPVLLKFGWPYWLIMFIPAILPSFDRFLILNNLNPESLAYYALAFRLASLIQLPIFGFQTAWGPFVYASHAGGADPKVYNFVLKLYLVGLILFGLVVKALDRNLVLLFSNETYLQAAPYIGIILLGFVVESISWITGIGIDLSKKTWLAAVAYGLSTLFGGAVTWLLVLKYEMIGLVLGGLLAKSFYTITKSFLAHLVFKLPFQFGRLFIYFVICILLFFSFDTLASDEFWSRVCFLLLSAGLLILFSRAFLFDKTERVRVMKMFSISNFR